MLHKIIHKLYINYTTKISNKFYKFKIPIFSKHDNTKSIKK